MKRRLTALFVGFLAFGVMILGRAVWVQIIGDDRIARLAKRQFNARMLIKPKRGLILDRNGEPLAVNQEIYSLAANSEKVADKKKSARILSNILGIDQQTMINRLNSRRGFTWIQRHLSEAQEKALRATELISAGSTGSEGFWLVRETNRVYPNGDIAANVLGSVNLDTDGIEGIELQFEKTLRGQVVAVDAVKDALGRPSFLDPVAAGHVKDGENIQLTLDSSLQFVVETELKRSLEETESQAGVVIVMDAVTGEILALATQPSFNPNLRGVKNAASRRNRAVTDGYEPGSTLKPVLMASALVHGHPVKKKIFGGNGKITVQGQTISEADSKKTFGWITLDEMIEGSSNVASARLALNLGAKSYLNTLRAMGFGSPTGLEFPGEISGWFPKSDKIPPLSLATIGFGHGFMATPMQVARAYAVFANGGWMVQPTLIKKIGDRVHETQRPLRVLPSGVAQRVSEAMLLVTEGAHGTGAKARLDGFRIAGKTGTSQVVDPTTKKYSRSHYVSTFVGFAKNVEPRIVVYTKLDRPKGIYYASETAAPLFSRVMSAVTARFSMMPPVAAHSPKFKEPKSVPKPVSAHQRVLMPVRDSDDREGKKIWKMPRLDGLTAAEVLRVLDSGLFRVEMKGFGWVSSQTPAPGEQIAEGQQIQVILSES